MKYKINDRVKLKDSMYGFEKGALATVTRDPRDGNTKEGYVTVDFDGEGYKVKGWYFTMDELELYIPTKLEKALL